MFLPNKYTLIYFRLIQASQNRVCPLGYTEKHHIIPKSLGGDNSANNIVVLTAREHFIAHKLLTKITDGKNKAKMIYAMTAMCMSRRDTERFIPSAKYFAKVREDAAILTSIRHKGKIVSDVTRQKISAARKGKPSPKKGKPANYSKEVLQKISDTHKGKVLPTARVEALRKHNTGTKRSDETRMKISLAGRGKRKPPLSDEHKLKISEASRGVPKPWKKGREPWNKGSDHTKETIEKIRAKALSQPKQACPHCGTLASSGNYTRWHGRNCKHHR